MCKDENNDDGANAISCLVRDVLATFTATFAILKFINVQRNSLACLRAEVVAQLPAGHTCCVFGSFTFPRQIDSLT